MKNIYILYYNNEQLPLTGRNKRIYFEIDNAKNAIYALARRYAGVGINNRWSKLEKDEKRKLINEEVKKFTIGVYEFKDSKGLEELINENSK